MPHYLHIENGKVTLRREYPSDLDLAAAKAGQLMIVWLEADPVRAEVRFGGEWERVVETANKASIT